MTHSHVHVCATQPTSACQTPANQFYEVFCDPFVELDCSLFLSIVHCVSGYVSVCLILIFNDFVTHISLSAVASLISLW